MTLKLKVLGDFMLTLPFVCTSFSVTQDSLAAAFCDTTLND